MSCAEKSILKPGDVFYIERLVNVSGFCEYRVLTVDLERGLVTFVADPKFDEWNVVLTKCNSTPKETNSITLPIEEFLEIIN